MDPLQAKTLAQKLRELREHFLRALPERGRVVAEGIEAALRPDAAPGLGPTAYRFIHTLAGTAGTYGFSDVFAAARALMKIAEPDGADLARRAAEVRGGLKLLLESIRTARLPEDAGPSTSRITRLRRASDGACRILVASTDALMPEKLRAYGFDTKAVDSPEALAQAAAEVPAPAAAVVDIRPTKAWAAALEALRKAQIPRLFLSDRGDLAARLEAARAGCMGFLRHPADPAAIVDLLDRATAERRADPYRILIVDDDADLARHLAIVLDDAGMRAVVVTDPMAVEAPLRDLAPDLILMDVYMPGCLGPELAAVIRQQEEFVATPIIYLSTETQRNAQIAAQRAGGDDFLVKPVAPDRLVEEVAIRAERGRTLRRLMARDGLTGLLNHTTLLSHLELEVAKALRRRTPISFAMIDIDHFKRVNDTHGHPTGDRVLRTLARTLLQRVRATDLVGRYGGEEFGLVLLDTPGPTAFTVIDEIRARFAGLSHRAGDVEFHVTFSAGLATLPPHSEATLLRDVADRALYQAKHQGRNRVVFAEG